MNIRILVKTRCGLGVTSLPLTHQVSVRSRSGHFPGWGFFRGFPSTVSQMSGNLGTFVSGYHMAIIYHPNHISSVYERQRCLAIAVVRDCRWITNNNTSSPLWARRQHARLSRSGPGFDPRSGQVSWVKFFRGFSSPVSQMLGSFRPQGPRISFGHHYHHHSSFITGANDLRCWRALKP